MEEIEGIWVMRSEWRGGELWPVWDVYTIFKHALTARLNFIRTTARASAMDGGRVYGTGKVQVEEVQQGRVGDQGQVAGRAMGNGWL